MNQCQHCEADLILRVNYTRFLKNRDRMICQPCLKDGKVFTDPILSLHPLITPEIAALLAQPVSIKSVRVR